MSRTVANPDFENKHNRNIKGEFASKPNAYTQPMSGELGADEGAPDFAAQVTLADEAVVRRDYDMLPPGRAREIAEYRARAAWDEEHGTEYRFEVVPEMLTTVTFQQWDHRGNLVNLSGATFDLGRLMCEVDPEDRLTEFGWWEDTPESGDFWYREAAKRGLVEGHDGPTCVYLDSAEDMDLDELARYPKIRRPKILKGQPIQEPLSVEDVLAEADEDGSVTATLKVSMEDMLEAARRSGEDGYDEYDLLAGRLSPLPAYDATYKTTGVDAEGNLLIELTANVRLAAEHTA